MGRLLDLVQPFSGPRLRRGCEHTDFLEAAGLGHVGTARTAEEAQQPQLYTIEGNGQKVTVAHIAAAHNTNGLPIPEEAPWAIQMIDIPVNDSARDRPAQMGPISSLPHCIVARRSTTPLPSHFKRRQRRRWQHPASSTSMSLTMLTCLVPWRCSRVVPTETGWVAYGMGNFISNQTRDATGSTGVVDRHVRYLSWSQGRRRACAVVSAEWLAVTVDAGHAVRPLIGGLAEGAVLPVDEMAYRYSLMQQILEGGPATEVAAPPSNEGHTTTVIQRSS